MKDLAVVFDFDDTLVFTQENYEKAIKWVKDTYLPEVSFEDYLNVYNSTELTRLGRALKNKSTDVLHPFHPLLFVRYFYEILNTFSVSYDKKMIEDTVLEFLRKVVVKEDSMKVLTSLKDLDLFIVTVGDEDWQMSRIIKTSFEKFFKKMFFVIEKEDTLKALKKEYKTVIMIGDSLRSDILAGNTAKAITIYLKDGNTLSYRQSVKAKPEYMINTLTEVIKIVNKYSFKHSTT